METVYCVFGVLLLIGLAEAVKPVNKDDVPTVIEKSRNGGRVVAGWPAQEYQLPHQANVRMVNGSGAVSSCGGSLIHHHWLITAAHCVANRHSFVVRIGLTNLTRPEVILETERKYIHPRYVETLAGVQTDDIALLGVDHVPYSSRIQPCRLQNSVSKNLDYSGVRLIVSGYGLTDDPWNGGQSSEVLRWVYLRGISTQECREWYNNTAVIQAQTICAEFYNDTAQSACQGDSGGPLTLEDVDGQPTMVGIVSFGSARGCNSPFPSAYVRPGHYHDWYFQVTGINFDWKNVDIQPEWSRGSASLSSSSN